MPEGSDGVMLHVSNGQFWTALGFLIVTLLTYVIRLERWRMGVLTLRKHEEICGTNQRRLERDIGEIKKLLTDQNSSSSDHRELVRNQLTSIGEKVAFLQGKLGKADT